MLYLIIIININIKIRIMIIQGINKIVNCHLNKSHKAFVMDNYKKDKINAITLILNKIKNKIT